MKKAIVYGFLLLIILSITIFISLKMFISLVNIIGFGSALISAFLMKTFIRRSELNVASTDKGDREERRLGMMIGIFGAPFLVTSIIFLIT
ncbi:hypothetical protein CEH05_18295 [Halobacillus halophilus]|uniref:hypothetical protein n=1 Tax=Halobacillus halophilus TaxID=1570 RepID=UPI00059F462B|nr:hypothetical protein [Halobacillus halophilus]ASF41003.1 hypothetical protein CEH05_18295 [Halobacillus halophilus]